MRIVSLLPSATEICFALGAGEDVVGVTFECDYPAAARTRRIVSTTALPSGLTPAEIDAFVRARVAAGEDLYKLDAGGLRELDPDIVITQDLCAVCALDVADVSSALDYLGCTAQVVTTNPHTLLEVLTSIEQIAQAINRDAGPLVAYFRARLSPRPPTGRRVALLEWTDPPYAPGHWLPEQVELAGGTNVLGTPGARSHPVEWSALTTAEVVVVAPCGFTVDAAYTQAEALLRTNLLPPNAEVWAVDSNSHFARPGPRLVEGVDVLTQILTGQIPAPTQARRLR